MSRRRLLSTVPWFLHSTSLQFASAQGNAMQCVCLCFCLCLCVWVCVWVYVSVCVCVSGRQDSGINWQCLFFSSLACLFSSSVQCDPMQQANSSIARLWMRRYREEVALEARSSNSPDFESLLLWLLFLLLLLLDSFSCFDRDPLCSFECGAQIHLLILARLLLLFESCSNLVFVLFLSQFSVFVPQLLVRVSLASGSLGVATASECETHTKLRWNLRLCRSHFQSLAQLSSRCKLEPVIALVA